MTDEATPMGGYMMPMDVEGGPTEFAEVDIEAEATGGCPCVPVERDGTPALLGCSPA